MRQMSTRTEAGSIRSSAAIRSGRSVPSIGSRTAKGAVSRRAEGADLRQVGVVDLGQRPPRPAEPLAQVGVGFVADERLDHDGFAR